MFENKEDAKAGERCVNRLRDQWETNVAPTGPNGTICTSERIKTSDPGSLVLTCNPRSQRVEAWGPCYTVSVRPGWDSETLSRKGREGLGK